MIESVAGTQTGVGSSKDRVAPSVRTKLAERVRLRPTPRIAVPDPIGGGDAGQRRSLPDTLQCVLVVCRQFHIAGVKVHVTRRRWDLYPLCEPLAGRCDAGRLCRVLRPATMSDVPLPVVAPTPLLVLDPYTIDVAAKLVA